jgi:hypothetical protein
MSLAISMFALFWFSLIVIPSTSVVAYLCSPISNKEQGARSCLFSDASRNSERPENTQDLLNRAARLRKEVKELESIASTKRGAPTRQDTPIEYADVANSTWRLSYRFCDEPKASEKDDKTTSRKRRFFGGGATLTFRSDGYTDLVSQEAARQESAKIVKVWGWDVERSNDDDRDYILFSMDVELLQDDDVNRTKERFYFQARQEIDGTTKAISLAEGTVTLKRDVVQKATRWGLFSPTGILAQFRYVGKFVAKPTNR